MAEKTKSAKQVRYLLSSVSPLTGRQKAKLKHELHEGKVHVKKRGYSKLSGRDRE